MAKGKDFNSKIVFDELENFFFDSFNRFIKNTVIELGTDKAEGGASPVHTGYFASSWTAGYTRPEREPKDVSDKNRKGKGGIDGSEEWGRTYQRNLEKKNRARSKAGVPEADSSCPPFERGTIVPRFLKGVVNREFDFRRTVFIGNKTYYRAYALEGGSVQRYVQGQIGRKVNEAFQEYRGFGDVRNMGDVRILDRPGGRRRYTPVLEGRDS